MTIEKLNELAIRVVPISSLKPHPNNAHTHPKHQIRQIAGSIRAFGFVCPVLIDASNQIVAGHGRVDAAKQIGMEAVPAILLEGLSEHQVRALIIADNRLTENAISALPSRAHEVGPA